jgi:phosphatidylinositol N-acetylglucosaminyltransferase subunit A
VSSFFPTRQLTLQLAPLTQHPRIPRIDPPPRSLISDFFLPVAGGVELHIFSLGLQLVARGHHVIVITHSHATSGRVGIRYLSGSLPAVPQGSATSIIPSLKVYHLPISTIPPHTSHASLPNFLLTAPYLRSILLRERIHLIHGHASLSSMAHEGMFYAPFLTVKGRQPGIKTIFTDHSLFGFDDAVGVLTNKLLSAALRNVDGVICVSHTG